MVFLTATPHCLPEGFFWEPRSPSYLGAGLLVHHLPYVTRFKKFQTAPGFVQDGQDRAAHYIYGLGSNK